ncbi:hypothetical protein DC74_3000 [Streptomyces noursei]|uniref:Uncharacterized protein n=1 Tax=Streptomyces noursei TaxID=1971 RepID=A0A059W1H4_STRNR|nr:hypothetical protein DC74_3000 [Streptomyces noursei]GCB91083.1 hypothetical protein SALB_03798 [Streptomyces noursei]
MDRPRRSAVPPIASDDSSRTGDPSDAGRFTPHGPSRNPSRSTAEQV